MYLIWDDLIRKLLFYKITIVTISWEKDVNFNFASVLSIYNLFRTVYILIHSTLFMKGDYYIYKQNISCDVTIHVGLLLRIAQGLKLARIHSSYLINYFVSHFYFEIVTRHFDKSCPENICVMYVIIRVNSTIFTISAPW